MTASHHNSRLIPFHNPARPLCAGCRGCPMRGVANDVVFGVSPPSAMVPFLGRCPAADLLLGLRGARQRALLLATTIAEKQRARNLALALDFYSNVVEARRAAIVCFAT